MEQELAWRDLAELLALYLTNWAVIALLQWARQLC